MEVKENHEIIIDKYPFSSRLNPRLLSEADSIDYPHSFKTNVMARMSGWHMESDSLETLKKWIVSLIRNKHNLKRSYNLTFIDTWFARYNHGDYTKEHDHSFSWMSFVYFVKCPRRSSPLIFTTSRKRIKAEEGKVIIFPAWIRHSVPKNRCDGRVVVAGNMELHHI